MNDLPLVSIVIPLYNGANYVRQAIDSALAQTYPHIEIVVVNDGSTDNGAGRDAILPYGDQVRYFEKENGGCASALNYGIRQAKGHYISWLSHDDLYYPHKVQLQVESYEKYGLNPNHCIISGRGDIINGQGEKLAHPSYGKNGLLSPEEAFDYLLFQRCFNGCGLLIPKALFQDGFYFHENQKFLLDWNLWLRFALSGNSFYVLDDVIVSNRRHSAQVTVTHAALQQSEREETIRELYTLLKPEDTHFAEMLYLFAGRNDSATFAELKQYWIAHHIQTKPGRVLVLKYRKKIRDLEKKLYHAIVKS